MASSGDPRTGPDESPDIAADASPKADVPPSELPPVPSPVQADLGRRRFFRQFAGEMVSTAATVVGAAQALQRVSAEAAGALLDPDGTADRLDAAGQAATVPSAPTGFRTAFREDGGVLYMIDQRRLPDALVEVSNRSASEVAYHIREMAIRGAPAIGQVAAIGLAMTAGKVRGARPYARRATLRGAANALTNSRPTAVNLRWAVDRVMARYESIGDLSEDGDAIADGMRAEADAIVLEATTDHGRLATAGLDVLPVPVEGPLRILTHCNTGPLACGQFGTALGVIQAAHHAGRVLQVWVDETRPYLQGARLTAWELAQAGVPHAVLPDVAAGHLIATGEVDAILVGADRVAANGDTANKVGTYTLAVLAARHGIPFYVCAPTSSVDLATPDGSAIPIEERKADEVLSFRGVRIAAVGTAVRNPAFDITPAELITGIITEEGVVHAPFDVGLRAAADAAIARWSALPGHDRPVRAPVAPAAPIAPTAPAPTTSAGPTTSVEPAPPPASR